MNETFEVLFLRQQLDVLGRQLPPRPPLTNADRLQLVWRYRLLRSLLKAIRLSARSRFGVGSTRIWRRLMLEIARSKPRFEYRTYRDSTAVKRASWGRSTAWVRLGDELLVAGFPGDVVIGLGH
jgi:hypothetical protein